MEIIRQAVEAAWN